MLRGSQSSGRHIAEQIAGKSMMGVSGINYRVYDTHQKDEASALYLLKEEKRKKKREKCQMGTCILGCYLRDIDNPATFPTLTLLFFFLLKLIFPGED